MKIQRKLCVDLTLDTDEPVAAKSSKENHGHKALQKMKWSTSLSKIIVHVDNNLTEMRNFRNAQVKYPDFFGNPHFVVKLGCESVTSFKLDTMLTDIAVFDCLKKAKEESATEVVISEYISLLYFANFII